MKTYSEKLQTIFFDVNKVPSADYDKNQNMEYNSDNSYRIVATWPREGKEPREKSLNFCSDIYALIRNQEVLEPLIPVLEEKFKHLDVSVGCDKDAQFSVRISPVIPSFSAREEIVVPLITFTNSYDGKVLAQATGGLTRHIVDEKGNVFTTWSTFLHGLSFSYKFKHNTDGIYSMTELSTRIDQYLGDFQKVEEQVALMKTFAINKRGDKMGEFLEHMAKGSIFPLKDIEETLERIEYESMVLDCDPNLWTIYNAMNYITESTEKALTKKMRMDVDAKVYVNMLEYMAVETKKREKKAKKNETLSV
jgi:hypothetical protein